MSLFAYGSGALDTRNVPQETMLKNMAASRSHLDSLQAFFDANMGNKGSQFSKADRGVYLAACERGDVAALKAMITEKGLDEDEVKSLIDTTHDSNGMHGTHIAIEVRGKDKDKAMAVLDYLYSECKADLFLKSIRDNTALHIAARSDHRRAANIILKAANSMWPRCRLLWIAFYRT